MKNSQVKTIAVRVLGTVVLATGFLFFIGRAPFMAISEEDILARESLDAPGLPPLPESLAAPPSFALGTGGMSGPLALQSTLGLFEAEFAGIDDEVGFSTGEHPVPGECANAGRRFIEQECPGCGLLGYAGDAEMLTWQQLINGAPVVRSVSRHCIMLAADGNAIVGTLTFGGESPNLAPKAIDTGSGQVPLIKGATRLASIRLGLWSATYDKVPRPASALQDMASALQMRGWREVSESEHLPKDAFGGQRVFTNDGSAVCVISLIQQGQEYQLTTIITLRG